MKGLKKAKHFLRTKSTKDGEHSDTNCTGTLESRQVLSKAGKEGEKNNGTNLIDTLPIHQVPSTAEKADDTKFLVGPICELWNEAYEKLRLDEKALVKRYEDILAAENKAGLDMFTEDGDKRDQLDFILRKKKEEIEKDTWKLKFGDEKEIPLKDLAAPVLAVISSFNDYFGTAMGSTPYTAIAWVGVGLILPLFLNPSKQTASSCKGLEYISTLIIRSSIREELYHRYYESSKSNFRGSSQVRTSFRDSLGKLYLQILKFQTKTVCYYSKQGLLKLAKDFVKWDEWDLLLEELKNREESFRKILDDCKDERYEEECLAQDQRHRQSVKALDSIGISISGLQEAIEAAQKDSQRTELFNWLSTVDASENYNNARTRHKAQTGEWLINGNDRFKNWQIEPNSFLWLHGKAGSGKTILSSTTIKYLEDIYGSDPRTALGYYYFSFNDDKKQDTPGMLSSLIKQLCSRRPNTPQSLLDLIPYKEKGHRPDLKTLEMALIATIQGFSEVFIIIDALDECPYKNNERGILLDSLYRIENNAPKNLHLLCTSRQEPDIEATFKRLVSKTSKADFDLSAYKKSVDTDIGLYIDKELSSTSYETWNGDLKELARDTLIEKADGMFQYVACQFDILSKCHTPASIRTALKNLPVGLDAVYDRILLDISREAPEKVLSLLKWLAFSMRPLRLDELAEAFALDPRQSRPFDEEEKLMQPQNVLIYLHGLVTTTQVTNSDLDNLWYDEDVVEIRFAHFSIQEYLVSTRIRDRSSFAFSISPDDAHRFLTDSCLSYHLHISQKELATKEVIRKFPLWEYSANYWGKHLDEIAVSMTHPIAEKAMQVFTPGAPSFLNMIKMTGPDHDYTEDRLEQTIKELGPPLYYAVSLDMFQISIFLIESGANVNYCSSSTKYATALQASAYHGYHRIAKLLIDANANVNIQGGEYGNALQAAAFSNNESIVQLLLAKGADINAQGGYYGNALQAAAYNGSNSLVQLLLAKGADINAQGGYYGNALQAAIHNSDQTIIQLLLAKGADINAQGGRFGNALVATVAGMRYKYLNLLLSHGAKLDLSRELEKKVRMNIMENWGLRHGKRAISRLDKLKEDPEKFLAELNSRRREFRNESGGDSEDESWDDSD